MGRRPNQEDFPVRLLILWQGKRKLAGQALPILWEINMDERELKVLEDKITDVRRLPPFAVVIISYTEAKESHMEDGIDDVRVAMTNAYMTADDEAVETFVDELGALDMGCGSGTYTFIVWFDWEELEVFGGGFYTPGDHTLVDFEPYNTALDV